MSTVLPFIVIGLATGAVYGLAGLGLVLTYKTSGVFNFAHGALATVAAFVFYSLYVLSGWSWPVAAVVVVLVIAPIMGLVLELFARRLTGASLTLQVSATVGLLLVIEGAIALIYPDTGDRNVPVFLGSGGVNIAGTYVQVAQIVTFGFALAATVGLHAFFRFSRRGIAMRAVVDNPELLDAAGTSPVATRRWAWVLGVMLVAASGLMFSPLLPLDPVVFTLLVVSAFGAAAIGAFTSLPMTLVGGLVIGVLGSLCTKWFPEGLLSGLPPTLPFVVLFVVLLVFPKRYLASHTFEVVRSRPTWSAPAPLQLGAGALMLVGLALVPSFAGIHLTDWTTAVATVIIFLSLGLLVRTSGQVSLAQVSFTAIGAVAFSHLTVGSGVPWLLALLLSGLIAVPIGAILAIPAIRLSGLYLALATFGFGILLQGMFYTESYMFGVNNLGLTEPRPHLSWLGISGNTGFYYVVLALAVLIAVLVLTLNRSRLGRLLRGIADSPTAVQCNGTTVNVTRVLVFCLSAFLAAVGGALVGVSEGVITANAYQPLLSLTYFALIIIVVGGEPWYALIAAGSLVLIPSYISGAGVATILQIVFGVTAILVAVMTDRWRVLPVGVRNRIDSIFGGWRIPGVKVRRKTVVDVSPDTHAVTPGELELQDLKVSFGGLLAVDQLSLRAPTGLITGLIGPNGAGKTTSFNACSGLIRATAGKILLDGHDVTRSGPSVRARRGLGRTFQKMELLDSLTVRENVALGAEGTRAGLNPLTHITARRSETLAMRSATDRALELCDLSELASSSVITLSTGQRRLVELARCLAGPYRILLLDEPSSGLDGAETERFGEILTRVVRERGVGILLVEHDMSLVLAVCEQIYVLDFGELIFHGTPAEIMSSPIVQAAYLGDASVEQATPLKDQPTSEQVA